MHTILGGIPSSVLLIKVNKRVGEILQALNTAWYGPKMKGKKRKTRTREVPNN